MCNFEKCHVGFNIEVTQRSTWTIETNTKLQNTSEILSHPEQTVYHKATNYYFQIYSLCDLLKEMLY